MGDSTLVRTIERKGTCKLQRIVNANDIVPLVPPSVAGFDFFFVCFLCVCFLVFFWGVGVFLLVFFGLFFGFCFL